ncbi:catechol 2,3-dioxygenase-like lactoylglutathione lyase family enzyme [Microvirga flocculans]|uniref:Catechol 2,3-dioxygenase-like lactoylglutathione lyase family enzyme n=1 Tax=Microvirga flocculans TaxID=217168 RepID=A0A7W6N6G2_9HYPH|nr:VOC family protein [Microvirga flocculans]MBB4038400.1 catechol 2,3-dioxygenase-like lactoylglutathione lyase family enzyme [Microvirga flocculans]
MLGHLSFGVRDLARSIAFYDAALEALGLERVWHSERAAGYGPPGGNDVLALFQHPDAAPPGPGFHLAFAAPNPSAVDAFYAAALAFGGSDEGRPGLRPQYHANYYAAFVKDPDGHKLEAVHQ